MASGGTSSALGALGALGGDAPPHATIAIARSPARRVMPGS
jgi:hypothetical protein